MNRGIWAALALLCATPSTARAQQAPATGGGKAGSGTSTTAPKGADKSSTKKPRKGSIKEPEASGPSPAARSLARRTKAIFMFAVESCTGNRSTCEPSLADDAERRFLEACGACTSAERCEKERDSIRAGTATSHADPCTP